MTMIVAATGPGFSLVAADTRTIDAHGARLRDGARKVQHCAGGWFAAAGNARINRLADRRIVALGFDRTREAVDQAFDDALRFEREVGRGTERLSSHVLIAGDDRKIREVYVGVDQPDREPVEWATAIAWAPGVDAAARPEGTEMLSRAMSAGRHVLDIVRAVAALLVWAQQRDPVNIDGLLDIGATVVSRMGYVRAPAQALVQASQTAFGPVPAPDPFPDDQERNLFADASEGWWKDATRRYA